MILYLLYMFITFVIGKILSFIFKADYMVLYNKLKNDLIIYLTSEV